MASDFPKVTQLAELVFEPGPSSSKAHPLSQQSSQVLRKTVQGDPKDQRWVGSWSPFCGDE